MTAHVHGRWPPLRPPPFYAAGRPRVHLRITRGYRVVRPLRGRLHRPTRQRPHPTPAASPDTPAASPDTPAARSPTRRQQRQRPRSGRTSLPRVSRANPRTRHPSQSSAPRGSNAPGEDIPTARADAHDSARAWALDLFEAPSFYATDRPRVHLRLTRGYRIVRPLRGRPHRPTRLQPHPTRQQPTVRHASDPQSDTPAASPHTCDRYLQRRRRL